MRRGADGRVRHGVVRPREDGWEAESERAMAAQGIPCERLDARGGARALFPSLGTARPRVRAATSPRPACCARSARCGRWPRQAVAHGARPGARPRRRPTAAAVARRRRAARGRRGRVGVRRRGSGGCSPSSSRSGSTRQELLFFDGGPAWRSPGVPGWVDYDRAMYGTGDFDDLGVKVALDEEGPPLDPDAELPPARADRGRGARATSPSASRRWRTRRSGGSLLPLRALARLELHRRPPPRARADVAPRRRLRPRLQARPGARRADGGRAAPAASRCPPASGSATAAPPARCARLARSRSADLE